MKTHQSFVTNAGAEEKIKCLLVNNGLQNIDVFAYDDVDSTSTRAKLFAKNRVAGITPAIFISRAQSAGRGTRARTFESPAGAGLYMSLLFSENMISGDPTHLTSYTAVVAARAIFALSRGKIKPKIKWVNDIVVADKKLGGILTESSFSASGERFFIVGIGINLESAPHSEQVKSLMTTLSECGAKIGAFDLLCEITRSFFASLDMFDKEQITEEYKSLCSIIGRRISISGVTDGCFATAIDIDDDRALVVKCDDGLIKKYYSGDVTIRLKGN